LLWSPTPRPRIRRFAAFYVRIVRATGIRYVFGFIKELKGKKNTFGVRYEAIGLFLLRRQPVKAVDLDQFLHQASEPVYLA
jgi:hypothetical protein